MRRRGSAPSPHWTSNPSPSRPTISPGAALESASTSRDSRTRTRSPSSVVSGPMIPDTVGVNQRADLVVHLTRRLRPVDLRVLVLVDAARTSRPRRIVHRRGRRPRPAPVPSAAARSRARGSALHQRRDRVLLGERRGALREDRPGVEALVHEVEREADLAVARSQRPAERVRAAPARQERRVAVDDAEARGRERVRAELPAPAAAQADIGVVRAKQRRDAVCRAHDDDVDALGRLGDDLRRRLRPAAVRHRQDARRLVPELAEEPHVVRHHARRHRHDDDPHDELSRTGSRARAARARGRAPRTLPASASRRRA